MPLNVQVASGKTNYTAGLANVNFKSLNSATLNLKPP